MKRYLYLLFAGLGVAALVVVASPRATSAINFFPDDVCRGQAANSAACSAEQETISGSDGIILRASALLSIVAGISAVVAILIAGIMFITAGGDTSKVGTAKQVIIYAVVGLIVIALARAIVVFIINAV